MAGSKKPKKPRKSSTSSLGPGSEPEFPLSLKEARKAMQESFSTILGERSPPGRAKAEKLLDKAARSPSDAQAEQLARQALAADPTLLEAYEMLADLAPTGQAGIARLEEGLKAGREQLGEGVFEEYAGHFWGYFPTRPYMQLRLRLASELWQSGRHADAIGHLEEMLKLNPNDNQGVREILVGWYLDEGRDAEAENLLRQYKESRSAWWCFCRALLTYRAEGATPKAGRELRHAHEQNEFMAEYLAGILPLPVEPPEFFQLGGETEAMTFARFYLPAWRETPGATEWLRKTLDLAATRSRTRASGRSQPDIDSLPQDKGEVWQVGQVQFDEPMELDGEQTKPWVFILVAKESGELISADFSAEEFDEDEMFELTVDAMHLPMSGEPRRPGKLEVDVSSRSKDWWKQLKPAGVRCEYRPELTAVQDFLSTRAEVIRQLIQRIGAAQLDEIDLPSLADLPQEFDEVWQVDVRQLPFWMGSGEEAASPSCAMVVTRNEHLVLTTDVQSETPSAQRLTRVLLSAMTMPAMGEARRPGVVQVRTREAHDELAPKLAELGVELELVSELEAWDETFGELQKHLQGGGQRIPAVCQVPGITHQTLAGFFEAAAEFYRRRPWRQVVGDTVIRVDCPVITKNPWFACVMGQMGVTIGVALYEDQDYVRTLLSSEPTDEPSESMRECSSLSLMYGEKHEAAMEDVAEMERNQWLPASPEAYLQLLRVKPGISIQSPLEWHVRLVEAAIRAIPDFLAGKSQEPREIKVRAGGEEVSVNLSFVDA